MELSVPSKMKGAPYPPQEVPTKRVTNIPDPSGRVGESQEHVGDASLSGGEP